MYVAIAAIELKNLFSIWAKVSDFISNLFSGIQKDEMPYRTLYCTDQPSLLFFLKSHEIAHNALNSKKNTKYCPTSTRKWLTSTESFVMFAPVYKTGCCQRYIGIFFWRFHTISQFTWALTIRFCHHLWHLLLFITAINTYVKSFFCCFFALNPENHQNASIPHKMSFRLRDAGSWRCGLIRPLHCRQKPLTGNLQ